MTFVVILITLCRVIIVQWFLNVDKELQANAAGLAD